MNTAEYDVVVLGAGPAGSIAARACAQAGLSVLLIDPKVSSDHHKIESFPASGAPLAEDIGLLETICSVSYGPAEGLTLEWRAQNEHRDFGEEGPLLLPRIELHAALKEMAEKEARVSFVEGRAKAVQCDAHEISVMTDEGKYVSRFVLDARGRNIGRRDAFDLVALPFSGHMPDNMGQTMHLESCATAWIWACLLHDGSVQGAVFQPTKNLAGLSHDARLAVLKTCLIGSAFQKLEEVRVRRPVASGLSALDDPFLAKRHLAIGDAALARDPIASHGLVHAMRSAVQSAVIVRTILDVSGDSNAAETFARIKHTQTRAAAIDATAQAYADQSRFSGHFWTSLLTKYDKKPIPNLDGLVQLEKPLTRAPILENDSIKWAPAIECPRINDFAIQLGPISAVDVASACRPAASLVEIATRLGRLFEPQDIMAALDFLIDGGAFQPLP